MRKIFFICVTVLICSIKLYAQTYDVIPQSQWEQLKEVRDSIGEISNLDSLYEDRVHPNGLPYHIYIPDNLEHDIDYPLVIFLHGYTDLTIHTHKGFPKGIWSLPMVQNDHPHILFVPRYRNNADKWFNEQYREMFYETLNALITELNNNSDIANIDTSRIYLTGFSEGGMGTWNYIRNYPNKFAAAAPLSGFFEGPQNENEATEIKHIPIWMFNGDGDNGVTGSRTSYDMLNAVEAPDVRYHEYQDHGHVIDDFAYFTEGFMDWFFFHNLNTTPIDNNVMGNQIDFQLFQNYPNPFNSQTTLQFSLPKASEVTIDLVNLRGQRIDTIVKSVFSEGLHQVSYDAENLSSGIYYYKLNSSSHVSVKKLLILR